MGYRAKQSCPKIKHKWLRNTEKCPTSLATRKMQAKTSLRSHLTQVLMAEINKQMITYAGGDVGEREHLFIAGGRQTGTAAGSSGSRNQSSSRSSYTTLGHIFKRLYFLLRRFLLIHVHCRFVHSSQKLESSQGSFNSMHNVKVIHFAQWHIIKLFRKVKL